VGEPARATSDSSASVLDYENVTEHEGDLIISGTQTYIVENCKFIQTGNVYLKDQAKLILRNGEIQINQSYLWQYEFRLEDYATMESENFSLTSKYAMNLYFLENTKGYLQNISVKIGEFSSVSIGGFSKVSLDLATFMGSHGIGVGDHSEVSITRSTVGSVTVIAETSSIVIRESNITWRFALWFGQGSTVNISRLEPGFHAYFDAEERITIERDKLRIIPRIVLNQTYISGWHIDVYYDSQTVISLSTLSWFGIFTHRLSAYIDSLQPQFYEYKQVGQITLNRTRIAEVAIRVGIDSEVTIVNCTFNLPLEFNPGYACIIDSVVNGLHSQYNSGSLCLERTTFKGGLTLHAASIYMFGNVSFKCGLDRIDWFRSNITRNYNAIVKDSYEVPASEVSIAVKTKDGSPFWNGTTNAEGGVDFNLTFADQNYTETLRLEAIKGNYSAQQDVGFLSDTPIILKMRYFTDLNGDGKINIQDITIIAVAYKTKPGDARWNPMADLDESGEINIIDITMVAKDYGKTV
jgi:hypothetical protein